MIMRQHFIFLLLLFFFLSPLHANEYSDKYTLGRGVTLYEKNQLQLTLAGHLSLKYKTSYFDTIETTINTTNHFGIENAAIMFYGSYTSYFSFLLEYGNENLFSYENSMLQSDTTSSQNLELRRFYTDITLDESVNLKLGRFLIPIGIYNPTYINALRWSNIRPLVAEEFFPDIITGVQLHGTVAQSIEYSIFTQLQNSEAVSTSRIPISKFSGGELRYAFGLLSRVALNYGQYKSDTFKEICVFGGANTLVELDESEFSAELLYKDGKWGTNTTTQTWWKDLSWYTQYVHNIYEKQYLSFRIGQKIRDGVNKASWDERNVIGGYIYRENSALSYKAEFRHLERTGGKAYTSDEVHISFSVLF
jgi:hypothetical protein